jgi:predicted CopG family antitoxin
MKATATITMSAPVLDRLRKIAKSEKRSLSQQLEMLVERHFATRPTRRKDGKKKEVAV